MIVKLFATALAGMLLLIFVSAKIDIISLWILMIELIFEKNIRFDYAHVINVLQIKHLKIRLGGWGLSVLFAFFVHGLVVACPAEGLVALGLAEDNEFVAYNFTVRKLR